HGRRVGLRSPRLIGARPSNARRLRHRMHRVWQRRPAARRIPATPSGLPPCQPHASAVSLREHYSDGPLAMLAGADPALDPIARLLLSRRGVDLWEYKGGCTARRILARARHLRLDGLASYAAWLEAHPDEDEGLLQALTINVTSFFRDPGVFETLRRAVVPEL